MEEFLNDNGISYQHMLLEGTRLRNPPTPALRVPRYGTEYGVLRTEYGGQRMRGTHCPVLMSAVLMAGIWYKLLCGTEGEYAGTREPRAVLDDRRAARRRGSYARTTGALSTYAPDRSMYLCPR